MRNLQQKASIDGWEPHGSAKGHFIIRQKSCCPSFSICSPRASRRVQSSESGAGRHGLRRDDGGVDACVVSWLLDRDSTPAALPDYNASLSQSSRYRMVATEPANPSRVRSQLEAAYRWSASNLSARQE